MGKLGKRKVRFSSGYKYILAVASLTALQACSSKPKILMVRSEPAEAEVCFKGRYGSKHFDSDKKVCVGSTPFEADHIEFVDSAGEKRRVDFAELESDKETFHVLVTRPGYATQAVQVPSWEHFLALRADATAPGAQGASVVIQTAQSFPPTPAPVPSPVPAPTERGAVRVTSDPPGALVYVNDVLKGNAPYTIEGVGGSSYRVRLEAHGFKTVEKTLVVESGRSLELSLAMGRDSGAQPVVAGSSGPSVAPSVPQNASDRSPASAP